MRIISFKTIREHWKMPDRGDSETALKTWYYHAKKSNWESSAEIKKQFKKASILSSDRVVFNIAGNKYRLVVKINYKAKIILIRFIGTHKEYDKIDAGTI